MGDEIGMMTRGERFFITTLRASSGGRTEGVSLRGLLARPRGSSLIGLRLWRGELVGDDGARRARPASSAVVVDSIAGATVQARYPLHRVFEGDGEALALRFSSAHSRVASVAISNDVCELGVRGLRGPGGMAVL